MKDLDWTREFPSAITVVDADGMDLIGSNSLDCHPEPSRTKLLQLLKDQKSNIYTIEKAGKKKMICQIPWYQEGRFSGIVELSIELPAEIPHFTRD
jgi:hypothetical protein